MAVVRGSLFSGRAAAQHDDADGSHQQGQTGDDQAPVVFVKQGTAQQGGVREFSVVYLLTDGGAFRIEVENFLPNGLILMILKINQKYYILKKSLNIFKKIRLYYILK